MSLKEEKIHIEEKIQKVNLRKLDFSPNINPLVKPTTVRLKNRIVRTATEERSLFDPETGEVAAIAAIYTIDEKDDEQFVKVFSEGVKAAFDLNRTAARVFQAVLQAYQAEKMIGGYADCVRLFWFAIATLWLRDRDERKNF